MSQTHQIDSCCPNNKAYTITYLKGNKEEIFKVCISCFTSEQKSKDYPDTLIKQYQRNVIKIICNSCSKDVTKSMGCNTCHSQESIFLYGRMRNG